MSDAVARTQPALGFLSFPLASSLTFSALTQRHGVDEVGRSAHSSCRKEESQEKISEECRDASEGISSTNPSWLPLLSLVL